MAGGWGLVIGGPYLLNSNHQPLPTNHDRAVIGHRSSLSHEDVPEGVKDLTLLLDRQDFEGPAENPRKIALPEEVVVVVPVDQPVAGAALPRVVLEPGAEGGEVQVPARPENGREAGKVPGPIGLLHMVKAAAIQQGVIARFVKRESKGVGQQKGHAPAEGTEIRARAGL